MGEKKSECTEEMSKNYLLLVHSPLHENTKKCG